MKTAFFIFFSLMLLSTLAKAQQSFNSLNVTDLNVNGNIQVVSTTESSKPCPSMTEAQRDALTPTIGHCVYNSDALQLNVYDGSDWQLVGGGGGINNWLTATDYEVDAVVIQNSKIYQCLITHTSGTFATDLAASRWAEVSPYVDTDTIGVNVKAENGSVENAVQEIQVPNNSLTNTATNKQLIETGNANILANPNFEHSTFSTSWTLTAGSSAVETTIVVSGKKSYKATLSAQTLDLYQDSTLYASQFAGTVQGVAMVRVRSTVSGIFVCPRQAGATQLSNCVQVDTTGTWGLYKVPFVLGATSNGVAIVSGTISSGRVTVGNVTGDVYVDDAKVEAGDILDTQPTIGPWVTYGSTSDFAGFGTVTCSSCLKYRQVGSNIEIIGKFTSGTVSGSEARINLPNSYVSAGTSVIPTIQQAGTAARAATSAEYDVVLIEPSTVYMTFGKSSAGGGALSKLAGNAFIGSIEALSIFASIPIASLQGSTNTYTSSCGANCADEFSAVVSGAGVVSSENIDWINGNASIASTSQYTLTFNSGVFTVAPTCVLVARDSAARSARIYTAATTSTIVVRTQTPNTDSADTATFEIFCRKTGADFTATRTIVGSFNEVVTTPGISRPVLYSAKVSSAGVVSEETGDWINGNCAVTATSTYTCTFITNTFSSAGACFVPVNPSNVSALTSYPTASSTVVRMQTPAGTDTASAFQIICHGPRP